MIEKIKNFQLPIDRKQLIFLFHIGILLLAVLVFVFNIENGKLNYEELLENYGEIAWFLLVYTIFVSLFLKLFRDFKIIQQAFLLRKWAGIAVFYFAFLHILFFFLEKNWHFNYLIEYISNNPVSYISAVLAFIIILILFITSAKYFKIILKRNWHILHKTTHLAFIFVAIHIAFIEYPQEIKYLPIILLLIYITGYSYLLLKKQKI